MTNVNTADQEVKANGFTNDGGILTQRRGISSYAIVIAAVVLLLICGGLILLQGKGWELPPAGHASAPTPSSATQLLASDRFTQSTALYLSLPGAGCLMDLYRQDLASDGTPLNLTNSAGLSEIWPVVSPDGSSVAYFGIGSDGVADLYVMTPPHPVGIPLTANTRDTDLHDGFEIDVNRAPVWSPSGTRLAFYVWQMGRLGNAVELYVAESDGSALWNITNSGHQVSSLTWLSEDEVAYVETRGNGKATVFRHQIDAPTSLPTPVATLELPFGTDDSD